MRKRNKWNRLKLLGITSALFVFVSISCVERETGKEVKEPPPQAPPPEVISKPKPGPSEVVRLQGEKGVYHTVERGQTLWRISRAYGVDLQAVSEINGIKDPTQISVGQKIFIPGAKTELKVEPAPSLVRDTPAVLQPRPKTGSKPAASAPSPSAPSYGKSPSKLLWPVPGGKLYSPFGMRDGSMHDVIDISAKAGTPVFAAADGKATYSDNTVRGYGNMIVIKHSGNLSTVYAHNRVNLVKPGDFVKRGDKIAEVGQSGRATGPHLHFEVREGKRAVDPFNYMR